MHPLLSGLGLGLVFLPKLSTIFQLYSGGQCDIKSSLTGVSGSRIAQVLVLCVFFVDRCLSLFILWPFCWLSFFDLLLLIFGICNHVLLSVN